MFRMGAPNIASRTQTKLIRRCELQRYVRFFCYWLWTRAERRSWTSRSQRWLVRNPTAVQMALLSARCAHTSLSPILSGPLLYLQAVNFLRTGLDNNTDRCVLRSAPLQWHFKYKNERWRKCFWIWRSNARVENRVWCELRLAGGWRETLDLLAIFTFPFHAAMGFIVNIDGFL